MLWLLASCSDYSFERPADEQGGAFECGSYLEEGEDLDQVDGCVFEEVTGSLTNIIDWMVPDFEGQNNGSDRVGMTPILLPIAVKIGIDPIHFGIIMILNLGIGVCTPPVGTSLMVGCGIGGVKIENTVRAMLPFYLAMVVVLMLVTFIPMLSLGLAGLLG